MLSGFGPPQSAQICGTASMAMALSPTQLLLLKHWVPTFKSLPLPVQVRQLWLCANSLIHQGHENTGSVTQTQQESSIAPQAA